MTLSGRPAWLSKIPARAQAGVSCGAACSVADSSDHVARRQHMAKGGEARPCGRRTDSKERALGWAAVAHSSAATCGRE